MSWTTTDLANVEAAIASGELTVEYAGKGRVTYRTIDELLRARQAIIEVLAQTGAVVAQPRRRYASFSSGL